MNTNTCINNFIFSDTFQWISQIRYSKAILLIEIYIQLFNASVKIQIQLWYQQFMCNTIIRYEMKLSVANFFN
jgi:hypothetical protein